MTLETNVAPGDGGSAPIAPIMPGPAAPADGSTLSVSDAARLLSRHRIERQRQSQAAPVEPASDNAQPGQEPVELQESLPATEGETAPEEAPPSGESAEAIDPAEEQLPPIEPPRSWTSEEKERFKSLPRETQEYLANREQQRDREVRARQNEAAELRKAFEAERTQLEQARQQYEAALPALMQAVADQQAGEFADIKTVADVERLAREDWPRYVLYDAHLKKVSAIQQEMRAAQERQAQEFQSKWNEFAKRQDELFLERVPEFADKDKASKIAQASIDVLKDLGFADDELAAAWHGQASLSLRDHRVQLLIRDAVKLREAQSAAKLVAAKPKPPVPVQRPGAAQSSGAADDARIQALTQQLERTGSAKDAAALIQAKRAIAARRSKG